MSLFRCEENLSEDENHTDAQIQKKKIRLKMNRSENDPLFTGKLNLSLKDLQNAEELWLVKLPRNCRRERMEGQEIILENNAENPLKLKSNGAVQNAQVMKDKFNLPFVCPQKSKDRISLRLEHGLNAEKALHNRVENFEDLEEDADTVSLSFKGKIVLSRSVETGVLPKPSPEKIERIPQPSLKRRHPFFGLDEPPTTIVKTQEEPNIAPQEKSSKKRKKRTKE